MTRVLPSIRSKQGLLVSASVGRNSAPASKCLRACAVTYTCPSFAQTKTISTHNSQSSQFFVVPVSIDIVDINLQGMSAATNDLRALAIDYGGADPNRC